MQGMGENITTETIAEVCRENNVHKVETKLRRTYLEEK